MIQYDIFIRVNKIIVMYHFEDGIVRTIMTLLDPL